MVRGGTVFSCLSHQYTCVLWPGVEAVLFLVFELEGGRVQYWDCATMVTVNPLDFGFLHCICFLLLVVVFLV